MQQLSRLDAAFLELEDADPHASLAIASVAVLEGPAPEFADFSASIAGRLALVPRYRQRVRRIPLDLGPPVWVDDPHFDLSYHLRNSRLPDPGGEAELSALVEEVMAERLDRNRPLWEIWLIEGLGDDHWALLSKVHHCMVDGIAGTDLYRVLLDRTPEPSAPTPDRWIPEPEPSTLRLTVNALGDMALNPIAQLGLIQATLDTPRRLLLRAAGLARGLATLATALRPATGSSLNGPVSQQRRYRSLSAGLPDVAAAAHRNDVTMNDVLLAAISGGFRDLLLSRQEEPAPHAVRSLVPVSVRAAGDESVRGNQISLLLPYLPVDIADPLERLRAVHSRLAALKASEEAETAEILTHLAEHEPFPLVTYGEWLVFRLPQRQIVTVTTNVPGLQRPAYALGRRVLDIYPYVPIATTVRLGVAVLSYCDRITIGITGDRDSTADIDLLAGAIHDNLALYNKTTDPA